MGDLKTGAVNTVNQTKDYDAKIFVTKGTGWAGQMPQIDFDQPLVVGSGVTRSLNEMWNQVYARDGFAPAGGVATTMTIYCKGYKLPYASRPATLSQLGANAQLNYTKYAMLNNQPKLTAFNLSQIDEMRLWLLTNANTASALQINNANLDPYKGILPKVNGTFLYTSTLQG